MAARFPQSASPVAYQIAAAYAGKIVAIYWPAGADSMHRLLTGETMTTIVSRAASGATFDATTGRITGTSSVYFSDSVAGGIGGLRENSDYTLIASYWGDLYNGGIDRTILGSVPPPDAFATGCNLQYGGGEVGFGLPGYSYKSAGVGGLSDDIDAQMVIAVRNKQADVTAKLRAWINGAEVTSARLDYTPTDTSLIGDTSRPLYFGGSAAGTGNTKMECEALIIGNGTPSDADMVAITTDPSALVEVAAADTIAPNLTSPTGTSTGSTTGSGTVITDEGNGTLYFLASINATETAATVKASGGTQAISSTGTKSVSFTGLTASTTYYAHYCHRDAAGNDSTVANSASFTTSAGGDSTNPTITGSITPSAISSSGFTFAWPAGSDNVAVTGYEYSLNGGSSWTDAGNVLTKTVSGLTASTAYAVQVRPYDAAGNRALTPLSATITTSAAPGAGTITTAALKNNTATTQASLSGLAVHVLLASTGALIVSKTAQTTNGSGVLSVTDAAITAGTAYLLAIVNPATGAVGITNAITAA